MDGCFATPPYHSNRASCFLHHIKRLALSKCHSGLFPIYERGPTPKMQQQVERLSRLPKAQQRVVMQMLEGVLAQASR